MTSGRLSTVSVAGAYWMSCIRSFWKTTLPGDTAMFSPTRNLESSVMRMRSLPLPRSRSFRRCERPFSRFSPPVSAVFRSTSGLVRRKLDGLIASTNCRV
jgi:hypothetical protein